MAAPVVKVADALHGVAMLFLDTAPVIYFVERNPQYFAVVKPVFDAVDAGVPTAVTSPITLAEALVEPYRTGLMPLQQGFFNRIVLGRNTVFGPIDHQSGRRAAELRASYNLSLPDALQVAVALQAGCDALLTNDTGLRRVKELRILVVDDLEP